MSSTKAEKAVGDSPFEVAIVGGGIIGLTLAIGLLRRDIKFKIYERAHSFRDIGAGIGFTPNAECAKLALDRSIHDAFRKISTQNEEDNYYFVDGYHWDENNPEHEEIILKLYLGERGFEGCRRFDFLNELVKHIPEDLVEFDKDLISISEKEEDERVLLSFRDGSTAMADCVIGSDGIHSMTRQIVLGNSNIESQLSYSHKYAIRGLIPMEKARAAIGSFKTSNRVTHCGLHKHAVTFPVANNKVLNFVALIEDSEEWSAPDGKLTAPASKSEVAKAFSAFSPVVRKLIELLPEQLDKWALFDTHNAAIPTYASGRICLAGDAAHAATPHHGAGAGVGIEDSLALATLLATVSHCHAAERPAAVRKAFQVYHRVRFERTKWFVESSRIMGNIYQFKYAETGDDHEKIADAIYTRSHKVWDYDIDAMVQEVVDQFGKDSVPES